MTDTSKVPLHPDTERQIIPVAPYISSDAWSTNDTSSLATATAVKTLKDSTTFVRFYAEWGTVAVSLRWTATTSNFDIIVPSGQIVDIYDSDTFAKSGNTAVNAIKLTWTVTNFIVLEY
jgi:hypothetical protein